MEESGKRTYDSDTYVVPRMQQEQELKRLVVQDDLFTRGMGGVLPEQEDPSRFTRVLDIGCGPGTWLLEMAQTYPAMSLSGIDINSSFIAYAKSQAQALRVADRVTFQTMDATLMLDFPRSDLFDLVTVRLGSSFLQTWYWPKVLGEMSRVTRTGGVIRVVDANVAPQTNGPATAELTGLLVNAFYQSDHLFEATPSSLTDRLPALMHQHTNTDTPQTRECTIVNRPGTPQWAHYRADIEHLVQTIRPFLQKWGQVPKDFDQLAQQVLKEIQDPDFFATIVVRTVWATKKPESPRMDYYDR